MFPALAFSQIEEIKEYTVQKGDTLWDISSEELSDTFLWPKIWKENAGIKNPDRIYPGQIIRIPLYLLLEERRKVPAVRYQQPTMEKELKLVETIKPVEPSYLVNKNLLLASSYIANTVPVAGTITGSPSGKSIFGNKDIIYVKTDNPVNVGDKFYIIRGDKIVNHPVTNEKIGYVIEMLGIAKIKKFEYGNTIAEITKSFDFIHTGDILNTFYEVEPPLQANDYRKPAIDGYIVATRNLRIITGMLDVVYIDKGKKDGIEVGDILKTIKLGENKVPNGTIQVISYKDTTATAIVRESREPVSAGNLITHFE